MTQVGVLAEELLVEAMAIAVARRHRRVGEAHVLVALLEHDGVVELLTGENVCIARFAEGLLAPFERDAEVRGYRDGEPPAIDEGLRAAIEPGRPTRVGALLERARAGGVAALLQQVRAVDVFERLVARVDLAPFRWDVARVQAFVGAALAVMAARGHERLLLDHALVALAGREADDGRFADALARLGHDPEAVRDQLRARIAPAVAAGLASLEDCIAHAIVCSNASRRTELGIDFLVVEMLRAPEINLALELAGVSRNDLLFSYVHGAAPADVVAVPGPVQVVFHNDDFTTQEDVTGALERHFDKSPEEAATLMMRVHHEGSLVLAVADGARAADAVRAMRAELPILRVDLRAGKS
ncbi:MAG: ATP-dependent Clp protease adaptor ClpS [Labilithrix sp.]|nr:ATP-dependent Clp protease adaptor ClpS [Labilithrix sp.]MCW5815521.1 ATP-dependent Clp protease adaptor ClpS [Labilithrix sp.]